MHSYVFVCWLKVLTITICTYVAWYRTKVPRLQLCSGFCRWICQWAAVLRCCSSCLLSGLSIQSCFWAAVLHSYYDSKINMTRNQPKIIWLQTCSSCLLSGLSIWSRLHSCSCCLLYESRYTDLCSSASYSHLLSLGLASEIGWECESWNLWAFSSLSCCCLMGSYLWLLFLFLAWCEQGTEDVCFCLGIFQKQ